MITVSDKILNVIRKKWPISKDEIFKYVKEVGKEPFEVNMHNINIIQYLEKDWLYRFKSIKAKLTKSFLNNHIKWGSSSFIEIKKNRIISIILDYMNWLHLPNIKSSTPLEEVVFSDNLFWVGCTSWISNSNWCNLLKNKWTNTWSYLFDINKRTMYIVNFLDRNIIPKEISEKISNIDILEKNMKWMKLVVYAEYKFI